tara:strand:- start:110 stop:484 length:375 start_codon:yes stop_codon:yes gene_type:complete
MLIRVAIMKILLITILLFISKSIFAETISCSYSFEGETQNFVLERIDRSSFKWVTTSNNIFILDILHESESRIVFGSLNTYGSLEGFYILYYDKVSKSTQSSLFNPTVKEIYSTPSQITKCIEF